MALTQSQLTALKADILADPVLSAIPNTPDGNLEIAAAYNLLATPAFIVWKTNISTEDIRGIVDWPEYINYTSVGERDAFVLMTINGVVNAAQSNIRAGFQDIFAGPQKANTRNALVALSKRQATRAEKLFAAGTGSDASPATMTHEGSISGQDVSAARSL